ncbi:MAG: choice-of-anchor D domain-containing protein [Planctomycetes bacterium]|nr:choice-of-anchor D domain-containing protein [Planctomycetota bacterium]
MFTRFRLHGILMVAAISALSCLPAVAMAAACADYQVRISATVGESPAQIVLSWPSQSASGFTVHRRVRGTIPYVLLASLPGTATGYTDATASVGTVYEYQVAKAGTPSVTSLATAAIRAPAVDQRGTVVLVVDATMAAPLAGEIARLEDDLVGDGWKVVRHDVPRFHVDQTGWKDAVVAVRNLIIADRAADPQVNSVLLLGHVPVPYSGQIAPDGHGDHVGAWPADVYYGDLDGTWNDSSVNTTAASRSENDNVPGDGKFDPSSHGGVELAVGRIDLARMGLFGLGEVGLLRRYLDKHHSFRHKLIAPPRRGMIDDNFGEFGGEAFASSGWGSYAALVGHANVTAKDFLSTLATDDYLLAYGCGGGSYTSCSGVGTSTQFSGQRVRAVHTLLFGSYFGDWDSQNNFLRAPLAADGYGLTSGWSGRPKWSLQSMAVGDPIGTSLLAVQASSGQVHVALMGDPTLRLHAVTPPATASAAVAGADVTVSWAASPDVGAGSGEGYHVYRGSGRLGPFTRLTATPVTATTFTDAAPVAAAYRYLVRAVALETSGTATYLNLSQAVAADVLAGGAAATLHLLSPNGGETVTAGGDLPVRWEGLAGGAVAIELSLDGGATWMEVGAVVQANGAATIRLPALAAGDARVRVRPAQGGAGDASDAGFSVAAAGGGVWDGGAGDLQWTSPANWTGDALPSAGQAVQFNAPAAATTVTVAGAQDLGTMRVTTGGSAAWTFAGPGTLSLRGGLTTAGSAAVNFLDILGSFGMELAADQVWDLGGGTVTCSSVPVSGAGRMTKRGAATLVLSGGGTAWSGGVQHERGTISVRQPHALGTGLFTFGTDAGTGLTAEFTYASNGDGGVVPTPIRCDNGRATGNLNVLSLAGGWGTRTTTFSGALSTGAALDPAARFVVDADSNRAGEVSTALFTGSHAAFDRAGVAFEVRTGTAVLASTAAAVGPGTGYIVGGDATRRHAALMLGTATTLARPITVGAASTHADTWGAPALGTLATGSAMLSGPITLPASGAPALHLLAQGGAASSLYVSAPIADGAGSAGIAIGGAVTGGGVVLGSSGTATAGTVVLNAPYGSTYDGGTIVCTTVQVGNLAGSATGTGPVELTGSVVGVRATTAGSGYATNSVVSIAAPSGGGSASPAAALVATVNGTGGITEMRLVRPGWGFGSAPAVTVATGTGVVAQALMSYGRLTGTGIIAGAVTVGANCTVAPSQSLPAQIGTLSTGSAVFAAGSTYAVDLSGSLCDVLAVTGDLDLSAAETLAVSGTPVAGTRYVIASWTGTRSGGFDTVTGLPGGWSVHADDAGKRLVIAQAAPVAGSAPEAEVFGLSGAVADGGTSPLPGLLSGMPSSAAWTVSNLGTAPLTLGLPVIAGQSNCTAVLNTSLPALLAPGGMAGLAFTITPAAAGPWSFTVTVPTSDADENPYDWTVGGSATAVPEIELRRGTRPIAAGGSDLGNLVAAGSALPITYQVANLGSGSLALTLPIAISGQSNCTAVVQTAPAASVAAGGSSPCVLEVTPLAAGAWSFTATLASDDGDEPSTAWTVSGTATGIPEIDVQRSGPVASGGSDAVGLVLLGASRTVTYTVANLGTAPLPVGGPVVLSSMANCTALIDLVPAAALAAGGSGTLQVTVTPTVAGSWSFVLAVGNGDADEGSYQWTVTGTASPPVPEIEVSRGAALADGGSDTVTGSAEGQPSTLTYVIANTGGVALAVTAPGAIVGSNCTVAVAQTPAAAVAPGATTAMVLTVVPTAPGAWSFPVSLVNDDADETPYDWTVGGTAIPVAPEIALSRGAATVAAGMVEAVGGTVQGEAVLLTWTIANLGNSTLAVAAPATVAGLGCQVEITAAPPATVAAAATATLSVRVTPSAPGAWSFPLSLVTNDADENPFAWTVAGSTAPEIGVARAGVDVSDGGSESIGGSVSGVATVLTWSIANSGSAVLSLTPPGAITGSNCTVTVDVLPAAAVATGAATQLVVSVVPAGAGPWSFPLALVNDDADENPFDWTVSGTAAPPPAPEIAVSRAGVAVADGGGDAVASSSLGIAIDLSWTIANLGNLALDVAGPATVAGTNCLVEVTQVPAASVAAGGSTVLGLRVTPQAAGAWSFPLSLATNDADENPYDWLVTGDAARPVLRLERLAQVVPAGGTDSLMGTVPGRSTSVVYLITDDGAGALTLALQAGIATANCSVSVLQAPAGSVAPGGLTSLALAVVPAADGAWSAALAIDCNDPDAAPFRWTLAGTAVTPVDGGGGGTVASVAVPIDPAVPLPARSAGAIGAGSGGSGGKGCGIGGLALVLAAAGWFAGMRRRRR